MTLDPCALVQLQPPSTLHLLALATCDLQRNSATSPSLFLVKKFKTTCQNRSAVWSKHHCILLHISTSTFQSKSFYTISGGCFQTVEGDKSRTIYQAVRTCGTAAEIVPVLTMLLFGMEASGGRVQTCGSLPPPKGGEPEVKQFLSNFISWVVFNFIVKLHLSYIYLSYCLRNTHFEIKQRCSLGEIMVNLHFSYLFLMLYWLWELLKTPKCSLVCFYHTEIAFITQAILTFIAPDFSFVVVNDPLPIFAMNHEIYVTSFHGFFQCF